MTIFLLIANAIAGLFGTHAVADAVHGLFTDMGNSAIADKATSIMQEAGTLIAQGASVANATAQIAETHNVPQAHAAVVVAAAAHAQKVAAEAKPAQ